MVLSCLTGVSGAGISRVKALTLEGERPCTGSRTGFPCRTDTVSVRRIFVCVIGSCYMPAWLEPASAESVPADSARLDQTCMDWEHTQQAVDRVGPGVDTAGHEEG